MRGEEGEGEGVAHAGGAVDGREVGHARVLVDINRVLVGEMCCFFDCEVIITHIVNDEGGVQAPRVRRSSKVIKCRIQ